MREDFGPRDSISLRYEFGWAPKYFKNVFAK